MSRNLVFLVLAGFAWLAGPAAADDTAQAVKDLAGKLIQTTRMVAVTDVTSPDKFVPDTDPNTLQIVYIPDPKAGTNHVSDDGEVVWFFGEVPVDDQQPYIFKAFQIRAKRQLGIK